MSYIPVPDLNPAKLFGEVATIEDLTRALATACSFHERKLTFPQLMTEQTDSKRELVRAFGLKAQDEFNRFCHAYPALAHRAEFANVATHPAFAVAAVRAFRAIRAVK